MARNNKSKKRNNSYRPNFWGFLQNVLIASMNKGQLPVMGVIVVFIIILLKYPSDELPELLKGIVSISKINSILGRAIKKGEGNDSDSNYEEIRYEGYGPAGVAIIVEAMTNNKNRTAAEIRSAFVKYGGSLGEIGSVSYSFKRLGAILLDNKLVQEEELFEFVVDNGSEDLELNEDEYIIYCNPMRCHFITY